MKQNVRAHASTGTSIFLLKVSSWPQRQPGRRPSCPTCRAQLTNNILVVPNYSLQHAIDKHVAALGTTGVVDWQPTGVRYQERQRRQG